VAQAGSRSGDDLSDGVHADVELGSDLRIGVPFYLAQGQRLALASRQERRATAHQMSLLVEQG
jgi:hypothetical protein